MIRFLYTVYLDRRKIGVFKGSCNEFLSILTSVNLNLNNVSQIYFGQKLCDTEVFNKILSKKGIQLSARSEKSIDERGIFLTHEDCVDPKDRLMPQAFIEDDL
jgi:hypothetical protein